MWALSSIPEHHLTYQIPRIKVGLLAVLSINLLFEISVRYICAFFAKRNNCMWQCLSSDDNSFSVIRETFLFL
jgi:hypothetical protein